MFNPHKIVVFLVSAFCASTVFGATNLSVWVYPGASGRLISQPTATGDRILDYSGIGYRGGAVPLPSSNVVPVKIVVQPVAGDNVANIQAAINYVSGLPLDTNGFRGAVYLSNGVYNVGSQIKISASGVVLRGAGSQTNGSGTMLYATATTSQGVLIEVAGSGSASTISGTTHTITNNYVPVGARSFWVNGASGLSVGQNVYVERFATSNWIHDLGMDLLGPPPDVPWTTSGYNMNMERTITHIEGGHIFVDAPITCAIDAVRYTNGTIRAFTWAGRITNCAVEHIFAQSYYNGNVTNEDHQQSFIQFDRVVNGWVRDVADLHFVLYCVSINDNNRFITVQDSQSYDPISIITGGRRYAFNINGSQDILFKNCYTRNDRHQFVTESVTIGPNAFADGLSDSAHAEAGPHQRWSTGVLWDNITVHGGNNDIQNAGNYGTGHGWEGGNCVIWNNAANGFIVQNPPFSQNWLIGSVGPIQNGTAWNIGYPQMPHAPGNYDSSGSGAQNVFPDSIYFNQEQDRLAVPNTQSRDYWLGGFGLFTNPAVAGPGGVNVTVDSTWSNSVKTVSGGQPLDNFDVVTNNHWVPFTFNFTLAANERVVAATLALSMKATNSANSDVLYFNNTTTGFTFSDLNWLPVATGTNITVRVLDLANQLNALTNGQLNVAVQGDIGIDWAMLELQVAPNAAIATSAFTPVADATVRGGTSAGINFGTGTTLTVRQDASANNQQQSFLKWDLSGVSGKIYQARVVLTPVSTGANNVEQGVMVTASNNWTENSVTWNSRPAGVERFATWIPSAGGTVSFDVTPQVLDAMQNDKQLSLELFSVSTNSVDYASRENANSASRPQLFISQPGIGPTISGIANQSISPNTSAGPIAFTIGGTNVNSYTLSGGSSNEGLVPDANIVFGGSDSNRTVTVTPLPNQSGAATITVTISDPGGLSASTSFTLTVSTHSPTTLVWNGPGSGANNWTNVNNWQPNDAPEYADNVKFFNAGGVATISNVNNYIGFNTTIASLQFGATNNNHATLIGAGNTLTISGGLTVGTETDNGNAQVVNATITGGSGVLNLINGGANLTVRQAAAASGGSQRATLDLSGLGEFDATVNQMSVGAVGSVARATGTLYLAQTNDITATGSPGILAGDNNSNGGGQNFIYLGRANFVFADSITIARQKATATLQFNPAFPNAYACFRGADGSSRLANWNIADHSLQSSSSSSSTGTCDFSGGTVDALVDTMIVGRSQKTTGANSFGALTFGSGIFDVNTLQIGFQAQSDATSGGIGQVNVAGSNAVLNVNTILELGHTSGGAGTAGTFGALNIVGGTAFVNSIAVGAGSGANSISMNNATLVLSNTAGSLASPIATMSLTNSMLQFSVVAGVTNCTATTLTTGGGSNAVAIVSVPGAGQFPLIAYSGAIGGAGNNFVLAALPFGVFGYLSNNIVNGSVDLVVTNYAVPDSFLTWDGNFSGDWDTETANWKNNIAGDLYYVDGNDVVFSDSASGATNVNITGGFAPDSVTVSNNLKNFTFQGDGNLTGAMALLKSGSGSLTIANTGSNDFTGGVSIEGGALTVGDGAVNGNLPSAGNVADNSALAFNRSDAITVPNVISGSGSVSQAGSGILVLNGANSFSGGLTVEAGDVRLPASSAPGTGAIMVTNGAVLTTLASLGNDITLGGGTLAAGVNGIAAVTSSNLTAANSTTSFVLLSDPQNPSSNCDAIVTGTLSGGGNIVVEAGTNNINVDNNPGPGFRLRGTASGGFSGVVTLGHNTKGELQSSVAGLFSPGGAGKFVMTCGDAVLGDTNIAASATSGFSEFNLRNNSSGNVVFGNDVELSGSGLALLNPLGSAPAGAAVTMGNLKIGGGQELGVYLGGGNAHVVIFPTVTLTGGNSVFSPKTRGFGAPASVGSDLSLGNISELTPGSGIVMSGLRTLTLTGTNTYSGDTIVNSGTLALSGSGSISNSLNIIIASNAVLDASLRNDGTLTVAAGQMLTGNGAINGNVIVGAGATLKPGGSLTTLVFSNNLTLGGGSRTMMGISKLPVSTNDLARVNGILIYGGTLVVTNLSGTTADGDSFKLFDATSYSGGFTNIVPAVPKPGLKWDTGALAVTGTLKIVTAPRPSIAGITISGTNLVINGANGQGNETYWLLSSTNLASPLSSWSVIATNMFDGDGGFSLQQPMDAGIPRRFYLIQLQ